MNRTFRELFPTINEFILNIKPLLDDEYDDLIFTKIYNKLNNVYNNKYHYRYNSNGNIYFETVRILTPTFNDYKYYLNIKENIESYTTNINKSFDYSYDSDDTQNDLEQKYLNNSTKDLSYDSEKFMQLKNLERMLLERINEGIDKYNELMIPIFMRVKRGWCNE